MGVLPAHMAYSTTLEHDARLNCKHLNSNSFYLLDQTSIVQI